MWTNGKYYVANGIGWSQVLEKVSATESRVIKEFETAREAYDYLEELTELYAIDYEESEILKMTNV